VFSLGRATARNGIRSALYIINPLLNKRIQPPVRPATRFKPVSRIGPSLERNTGRSCRRVPRRDVITPGPEIPA
jgi:hypothetical protein